LSLLGISLLILTDIVTAQAPQAASSPEFFENKVRPILANKCFACHTESNLSGLRLDSREAMIKGGGRGPAIIPGDEAASLLMRAIRQTDSSLKMPKGGKLSDTEIEDMAARIQAGAAWPKTMAPVVSNNWNTGSSCGPIIIIEHSAEAAAASNRSSAISKAGLRGDEHVADALMIPLAVIVSDELSNGDPQSVLSEQNHALQAGLLNAAYEPLGVAVQVRRPRRQFYRFRTGLG
jgi:hypothetical protein